MDDTARVKEYSVQRDEGVIAGQDSELKQSPCENPTWKPITLYANF